MSRVVERAAWASAIVFVAACGGKVVVDDATAASSNGGASNASSTTSPSSTSNLVAASTSSDVGSTGAGADEINAEATAFCQTALAMNTGCPADNLQDCVNAIVTGLDACTDCIDAALALVECQRQNLNPSCGFPSTACTTEFAACPSTCCAICDH